ncbi:MAG TPA: hypothetical protein VHE83_13850 [Mycobacteriales bacterium]|nr:hypothetical protein [Mycobacteriales bacterium]
MKLRTRLGPRVIAALAVGAGLALSVPAGQAAPRDGASEVYVIRNGGTPCAALSKTLHGSIIGMDHRLVNAMISMDIQDATGRVIDGNGCVGSSGYGLSVHVNYSVPSNGAVPGRSEADGAVTQWSVTLPSDAAKVYIEVYPQRRSSDPKYGGTDKSHYGFAERPGLKIGASGATVKLALPVASCSLPHGAGTLTGRFLSGGRVVRGVRVSAFSEATPPSDPVASGPLGFGIWNGSAGQYRMPLLASGSGKGQPYTLIARLADGRSKTFVMKARGVVKTGVRPCKVTTFDLSF